MATMMEHHKILARLAEVLQQRKQAKADESYVAALYAGGDEAIINKILEEAAETANAARSRDRDQVIHETADLWFHTLVMLAHLDLEPDQVLAELQRRFGVSGHEEKASRS